MISRSGVGWGRRLKRKVIYVQLWPIYVFPKWLSSKESSCNAGDPGLIPGSGRSSGKGNGYPLQYSCLGNPMDRGAWWATVHVVIRVRHDLVTELSPR